MIQVLIADDQPLVRAGLRALLDNSDDIEVVAEAQDGAAAVQATKAFRPDVVLMDIRMPVLDGLQATAQITADKSLGDVRVIILTTFAMDQYVFEALHAGASGFLVKDVEPDELRRAVSTVIRGDGLLAPSVTRRLIAQFTRGESGGSDRLVGLTARERDVLSLVGEGLSNAQIAEKLGMSPATAKTHVGRIMTKTDAHERAQLVILAYEVGLVRPGWL
ncbi:DNA-binding NarL/FixJ family response regulator [Kibdelosporangium banguiense]|uniref:DNA-binding NarL/FixJ family response regulator n=1 Tax=Kibdelosporangium banguiense TaxID=1365924 RepID=A0ABS4TFF3_9PSEU|nr:response regulator transcription factor [Kibdelosporangium banguiense]MBP2323130.1 DNA-binding NarL/FixJ family response regulator [Kibdelosporangium banguiense]